jgi:excisionase family DNA binding protein
MTDMARAQQPVRAELFDPLLTADEVAAWLRKPKQTLYAWRARGQGPRGLKVGGDLRYRRSDVEAWLAEHADVA